jgi:hypothetical protein
MFGEFSDFIPTITDFERYKTELEDIWSSILIANYLMEVFLS